MNEIDLLPCPVCGRQPAEAIDPDGWYRYRCRREDFAGTHCLESPPSKDKNESAHWWNFYIEDVLPTMRVNQGDRIQEIGK